MSRKIITALTGEELHTEFRKLGLPDFRLKQVQNWLYKCVPFSEMRNLPKELTARLEELFVIDNVEIYKKQESVADGTKKYLFKLYDDELIESVAMQYKHGMTICVSTQVGCGMGCTFCSSAKGGLKRNLSAHEMLAQVAAINRDTETKASNVVLMGTGEPLANYDNVIEFMKLLHKEDGLNISYRNISLSTCGIIEGINRLKEENIPINLCISLHNASDDKRKEIMPVANSYKVSEIVQATQGYFEKTGRRVTFEYALIEGENDAEGDIKSLIKLLKGQNVLVNLIPLNAAEDSNLRGVSQKKAYDIMEMMKNGGINATVRRTLGADIDGACGQLRAREIDK